MQDLQTLEQDRKAHEQAKNILHSKDHLTMFEKNNLLEQFDKEEIPIVTRRPNGKTQIIYS